MLVESGNPAHSLADSTRMREALAALDLVVVIDVAMTETARLAHYVLPAPSQYEKWEATFFNFEFPAQRVPPAPAAPRPRRRTSAGAGDPRPAGRGPRGSSPRPTSRRCGRPRPRDERSSPRPSSRPPPPTRSSAPWPRSSSTAPSARRCPTGPRRRPSCGARPTAARMSFPDSVRRAGFEGEGLELGERLFDAVLASPSGVRFTVDEYEDSWRRVRTEDGRYPPRHPRAAGRAGHARSEPPARRPRLPVRPLGRGTALVHGQHDLPGPDLAQAGPRRRAASAPGRRRADRHQRRRPGAPDHEAGDGRGPGRAVGGHAAGPHLAPERDGRGLRRPRTGSWPPAWRRTS